MTEEQRERLREATAEFMGEARRDYLRTKASALTMYDTLQARMRSASGRSESPQEWCSEVLKGLRIPSPSNWTSVSIDALARAVQEVGDVPAWLDLVESESGYLVAVVRLAAEERREAREEAKAAGDGPAWQAITEKHPHLDGRTA